jgi:hypothetical protein
MISKRTAAMAAAPALVSMFTVAYWEAQRGTPLAEVHLITSAPVTVGTSIGPSSLIFHNAITEAEYIPPTDSHPLPLDGVTFPST